MGMEVFKRKDATLSPLRGSLSLKIIEKEKMSLFGNFQGILRAIMSEYPLQ